MQLQYEDVNEVPEELKESFVEFKEGDKTVFMHKDLAETKKEFYRQKGDLTQAQRIAQEESERRKALEAAEAERQAEKERLELDAKKKNGQYEEILDHQKAQHEKEKADLKRENDELKNSMKAEKKNAVVNDLAALGTDSTRAALKRLIDQDLAFADSGELVVIENGKATSLTIAEYKAKLADLYPSLVSESHGKGGIGKGGTGSASTKNDVKKLSNQTQGYLANLNN